MDTFDEVMKRNDFDLEGTRNMFYEYCRVNDKKPDVLIDKSMKFILKSIGVVSDSYWKLIKATIDDIHDSEDDEGVIFGMTTGLLLAWEKIEKENIKPDSYQT